MSITKFASCLFLVYLQLSPGLARSSPLSSKEQSLRYVISVYPKKSFAKSDPQKTDRSQNKIGNWKVIYFSAADLISESMIHSSFLSVFT